MTLLLVFSQTLVLGQAPISLSGYTMNSKDTNWSIYNEDLVLSSDGTFSAIVTNNTGTFTASGTYVYAKKSDRTGTLSLSSSPEGPSFNFTLTYTDSASGTYVKIADYGGGTTDTTSGPFTLTSPLPWEDYDDFSGGSLSTDKWDLWWGAGGRSPAVVNGALELAGSGNLNDPASSSVPEGLDYIPTENLPSKHSVALIEDEKVYGLEAEFMIPNGAADDTGLNFICFDFASDGSKKEFGPELEYRVDEGLALEFAYDDPVTGESKQISRAADFDTYYKMSLIHTDSTNAMFLNGEKIVEYSSAGFDADVFGFAAFNDDGHPYSTYVKNVRVLRSGQTAPSLNITPLSLRAFRDQVYLQGQNGVSVIAGAGEINFDLELANKPTVSAATLNVDGSTYNLANLEGPSNFRTTFGYSSHDNELFDVESSSASDWSSYLNGKTFSFSLTVDGHDYSYSHYLPAQSALPPIPNLSLSGTYQWKALASGGEYVEIAEGSGLTIDWGSFSSAGANDFITVSAEELIGDDETEVLANTYLSSTTTSYELPTSLFKAGKNYSFYVEFHKVTQSENPTGFTHKTGTDTSQPLLQTSALSVTALDIRPVLLQAETVVSTPDGKPVVVRVGDAYKWNDSLDGVTVWGVWKDEDDGWTAATIQYVDGKQKGNIGLYDQLTTNLIVDHPYVIDESGMIKVTEDTAYQYYQVTGVENGVIQTADDSVFPLSDTSWFFTTKAAAEEYYYSKAGYPNPKGWLWFDQYPWVYSQEEGNWLYFKPSGDKIHYYSVRDKAWREFTPKQP
ncbi:MAG: hypothetical protein O3B25_15255 [Verrucomicrobia bacterium]|nr:hypothetical protein [Verrucomicrobiota bacterium]